MAIYIIDGCVACGRIFKLEEEIAKQAKFSANGDLVLLGKHNGYSYCEDSFPKGTWADSLEEALKLAEALRIKELTRVQLEMHRIIALKFEID